MRKLFYAFIASIAFVAQANQIKLSGFDFVAPSVFDAPSNAPKEVGSIVYDSSTNAFYGNDSAGNWVPLSASQSTDTYVSATSGGLTTYSISAGAYGDLNSISLVAGEWDITAETVWFSNGATTTTTVCAGVSTTAGNSSSGLTIGDNQSCNQKSTTTQHYDSISISRYRVVPNSTTTYYLKSIALNSITNLQIAYKITARRVR